MSRIYTRYPLYYTHTRSLATRSVTIILTKCNVLHKKTQCSWGSVRSDPKLAHKQPTWVTDQCHLKAFITHSDHSDHTSARQKAMSLYSRRKGCVGSSYRWFLRFILMGIRSVRLRTHVSSRTHVQHSTNGANTHGSVSMHILIIHKFLVAPVSEPRCP